MSTRTGRKTSGGRYIRRRKKKLYEKKGQERVVKLSKNEKRKILRITGGNEKVFLLTGKYINIGSKKIEIKNVLETPSNKFLARQNVLTKGTIVETELGKAKITNRPSQEGMINGVLIGKK